METRFSSLFPESKTKTALGECRTEPPVSDVDRIGFGGGQQREGLRETITLESRGVYR